MRYVRPGSDELFLCRQDRIDVRVQDGRKDHSLGEARVSCDTHAREAIVTHARRLPLAG